MSNVIVCLSGTDVHLRGGVARFSKTKKPRSRGKFFVHSVAEVGWFTSDAVGVCWDGLSRLHKRELTFSDYHQIVYLARSWCCANHGSK